MPTPSKAIRRAKARIPLGRWLGIEVGADLSWLIVFMLVTLSLSSQLAHQHPSWSAVQHWTLGLVTSVLFFVSIVLHELGHSLVAIRRGVPVRAITLFVFGGVAWLEKEPERPRDELAIAVAGPAMSLALALLFGLASRALGPESVAGSTAWWLASINGVLFLFNLIPGFPLDGGRVLRAILWGIKKDLGWATRIATGIGGMVAYGMLGIGVWVAIVGGNFFGGLWIGFIGWFLLTAARSTQAQVEMRELLGAVAVSEVMDSGCEVVSPSASLREVVETGVLRRGRRCFLVGRGEELRGLLTLHEIKHVRAEDWSSTSVQAAMVGLDDLATLSPEASLYEALQVMDRGEINQVPIMREGALAGVLTRERLLGVLRNQLELRA